jgi:uncharacterized membrane protein
MEATLKADSKHKKKKAEDSAPASDDEAGLERIVFFSDAVIAIAITLLALDIRLPGEGAAGLSNQELLRALAGIANQFLGYIISFLVIGMYWIGHHNNFHLINRYDRRLMVLNILFLLLIAFIPFPTRVMSENGNMVSTIFYAASLAAMGLLGLLLFSYAARNHYLLHPNVSEEVIRRQKIFTLLPSAVFLLSIGLAFINTEIARLSWLLALLAALSRRSAGPASGR